ncbi:MAG: hypothetical protein EOL88_04440 [Bacteroidia bacterium]|nr:hypothetical protein [Bacteroidia bacterium]
MDLTEILSITGKPGLFKMVANVKNGLIVESLIDNKRFPVFAHERISSLEEISIFTMEEDLPLKEVFKKIADHLAGASIDSQIGATRSQTEFFKTVIPNYDEERVYSSHIKKILTWYKLLQDNNLLNFEEENKEDQMKDATPEESAEKSEK